MRCNHRGKVVGGCQDISAPRPILTKNLDHSIVLVYQLLAFATPCCSEDLPFVPGP